MRTQLPGFDPIYYLYWYGDVRTAGVDPLNHYMMFGWREGRDPSAGFSINGYLATNLDVKASGMNPLVHLLEYGLSEGRKGFAKESGEPAPAPLSIIAAQLLLPPPNASAI